MTVVRAQAAPPVIKEAKRLRHVGLLRISTARAVIDYLKLISLIMLILLVIAWSIDLARYLPDVRAGAEARGQALLLLLPTYLFFRTAEFVTKFFPIAVLFGVFLAEIWRRVNLESVVLVASGMTLRQRAAPLLILGLMTGLVQGSMEAWLRPAAMMAHIEMGIGSPADRFQPGLTGHVWFVTSDATVRARVMRDEASELRDALIFTGLREAQFDAVYAADRLVPTGTHLEWRLSGVERWEGGTGGGESTPVDDLTLKLDLIPEQLRYLFLSEFYWPTTSLQRLAELREAHNVAAADLALWRRVTYWFLPGALAFMAVGLAHRGFIGRRPILPRLIALAVFGHMTVVSVRVLWAVGKHGLIPAPLAASATVVFALLVGFILFRRGP